MLEPDLHLLRDGWEATAPTLVELASSRAGALEGEPLVLSARVRAVGPPAAVPTGVVDFVAHGRRLGSAPLDGSGSAALDGVLLAAGVHAITAVYGGDPCHAPASSNPLPQAVVAPAARVVVALAAPTRSVTGIRLEAELLDPRTGRLVEPVAGVLHFLVDDVEVAQAHLSSGQANVEVDSLPSGMLTALFPGDDDFAPARAQLRRAEPA